MQKPLLSIDTATVRFFNQTLFTNLNFGIMPGQHWALIGKSGSGKSALLNTIAGRFNITNGTIDHSFKQSTKQSIAFVEAKHHFKNLSNTSSFYYQQRYNSSDSEDAMTVREYFDSIAGQNDGAGHWDMDKVLHLLKLSELQDKQLIKLSNGETKRLMIAAALLKNPVLLLLDNPLAGLDQQTRNDFNTITSQVSGLGISIIMATSPHEIPDAITHIAILNEGAITHQIPKKDFDPGLYINDDHNVAGGEELSGLLTRDERCEIYHYVVKMNDVKIKYGDKTILKNINWEILPGERWALLGPNGAGKSTLLSLINGDNPQAYANDIVLFDRKRGTGESIWDIKSKIGFVSSELHQYFPMDNSCLQVIESGFYETLGLFRPSVKTKANLALQWMKTLEIDKYAHLLLRNIPASAQRLCLLARALIKNPTLLILDEPSQGMDDHQQKYFKNILDTICRLSSVTLIYVTHYQQEIPESVTKVLKLNHGEISP